MSGTTSGNTTTYSYSGSIVPYQVTQTGLYDITAIGAAGSGSAGTAGGLGAEIGGDFVLNAGQTIAIAVGGTGTDSGNGGGGGGGSFVVLQGSTATPLVVAGGGGGGRFYAGNGGDALTGTDGGAGVNGGAGGTGGSGGQAGGFPYGGGGGGGFLTDGGATGNPAGGTGGASYADKLAGGDGNATGGFGGGGGVGNNGAGGGGGYSGGGGGGGNGPIGGGGGGGSFDGSTISNADFVQQAGVGTGNGQVTITLVKATDVPSVITVPGADQNRTSIGVASVTPFAGVTVTEPNSATLTETITVTPSSSTSGTLSDPSAATDGSSISNGAITLTGDAGTVTAELDALRFTPAAGQFGKTTFTITDVNSGGQIATDGSVSLTVNPSPPTLVNPTLTYSVAEGQTLQGLYQAVVQNVQDTNPGAQISIQSLGLSNTMGFAYLNSGSGVLTYTADGDQPSAKQPQDSFTYTATDNYGQTVTGTVSLNVTGANEATQVGTSGADTLTASSTNTRLVGGNGDDTLTANAAKSLVFGGNGNDTINVNAAQATVYGGTGNNTVNLGNTANDTIVLQQGGTDQINGFNLHNDVLDLTQVLEEAQASYSASEFTVTDSGNNATLSWAGSPSLGGGALAVLNGVGPGVTLQTLVADSVLKTS